MGWLRSGGGSAVALPLALFLAGPITRLAAQAPADPARVRKSVYGKLLSVDKSLNGVIMESDSGKRLAWRFDARVIAELTRFKPGDAMIVIYRQGSPSEKRVTAIAFPGTASTPTYVNTTGFRVVLRSAPAAKDAAAKDVCGGPDAAPISESIIPVGGVAEAMEACWCCAPAGETCDPGNKSGVGRALLVHCFK
jgi:hypothetical protein